MSDPYADCPEFVAMRQDRLAQCEHGGLRRSCTTCLADVLEIIVERQQSTIDSLRGEVEQFQKYLLQKSAQVRAETALRVEAEKRLADIIEILEPLDPPESYAAVVHKIAILANPERYACDPICEPAPTCCQYHRDGGDTYAACWNYGN